MKLKTQAQPQNPRRLSESVSLNRDSLERREVNSAAVRPTSLRGHFWTYIPLAVVLAISAIIFFPQLSATHLWDEDEGFYASTALEMYFNQDWIVPQFNGELFGHKPPWMYWMMMLGYSVFGPTELGARFFSAVFAVIGVGLTFQLGRHLFNVRVGMLAGIILASSIMFTVVGRSATPDGFLVCFTLLAFYLFCRDFFRKPQTGEINRELDRPPSFATMSLVYTAIGFAILTKGPIGLLFPITVIGLTMLVARRNFIGEEATGKKLRGHAACLLIGLQSCWRMIRSLRPLSGVIVMLLVAGPWYLAVGWETDWQFHREFFGVHHFQRATTSMEGHRGSLLYYPTTILIGMYPWTVATVPMLLLWLRLLLRRRICGRESGAQKEAIADHDSRRLIYEREAVSFIGIWAAVYVLVFSLAATKLPNYILPAYPAFAIMFAVGFDAWLGQPSQFSAFWHRSVLGVLMLVGLLLMALFPLLMYLPIRGETVFERAGLAADRQIQVIWLGLIGVPAFLGGLISLWCVERGGHRAAFATLGFTALVTVGGLWNFAAPLLDQFQCPQIVMAEIHQRAGSDSPTVATFDFFRPTMVFYHRRPVTKLYTLEQVAEFFRQHPRGYLILEGARLAEVRQQLPPNVQAIYRRARFPDKGELVVLACKPEPILAREFARRE